MRVSSIGSGSKGNGTLVQGSGGVLLVDCGFGLKDTLNRLAEKHITLKDIDAILVTHEHSDHGKGVGMLARHGNVPVYCSAGTFSALKARDILDDAHEVQILAADQEIQLAGMRVTPIAVPHDARECFQFIFRDDETCFGLLTDTGSITPYLLDVYKECQHLLLEFNHDWNMLWEGVYPESLKERVSGRLGHLSNEQAMYFLENLSRHELKNLIISHISEQNNSSHLLQNLLAERNVHRDAEIVFATQNTGFDWIHCC